MVLLWAAVASLTGAAVLLILRDPRPDPHAEELTALGWTPFAIRIVSGAASLLLAAGITTAGWLMADARVGLAVGTGAGVWLPRLMPVMLRSAALAGYRTGRDRALLVWLQRVRLYSAVGTPLAAAAVEAAEQVPDRAFASVAAGIDAALEDGRDPIAAAARKVAGSSAETLLATITTVERSGAGSADLIDRIVDRAIATLTSVRRENIERQSRSLVTATTLIALLSGLLIMAAVALTLPGLV